MAKIYFMRHQARGVLWQFPFAALPTQEQKAAVAALCDSLEGTHHKKTGEPHWLKLIELDQLGPKDVPEIPAAGPKTGAAEASAGEITVTATGTVTPAT